MPASLIAQPKQTSPKQSKSPTPIKGGSKPMGSISNNMLGG
jgi:hypothetical protein